MLLRYSRYASNKSRFEDRQDHASHVSKLTCEKLFGSLYNLLWPPFFVCGNSPIGLDSVGARELGFEPLSFPALPGGAESLDGSFLSSPSGLSDVGSPSDGGF